MVVVSKNIRKFKYNWNVFTEFIFNKIHGSSIRNILWKLCFPLKGTHKIIEKVLHGLNDWPFTDNRLVSWSSLMSNKHMAL